jgi:hypothetical protein
VARARYADKRTLERDAGVGGTASRPIVVEEEAEPEEDDDTRRIGELSRLAEDLGYPQDEDAYDMVLTSFFSTCQDGQEGLISRGNIIV